MTEVDTPASSGWILCENTSLVSQCGCFDESHAEHASACRRREAACLARASGLRAATRPIRAAFPRRSVAPSIAQFAQWFLSGLMAFPQPLQACSGFGRFTPGTSLPFTSRLLRCVRRVAINCRVSLARDQRHRKRQPQRYRRHPHGWPRSASRSSLFSTDIYRRGE